ncbi:MAG: type II toxin-antitoxin system VapC family toxin [Anaerolineales bacterium]|nr:type II toxin-antitoxin system VapC family toxin [Anaerolineales bacterium]
MIAVFDTNIVIDALNGLPEADAEYARYDEVLISQITWMEVLVGAANNENELHDFLEKHFQVVSLNAAIAETAVQLRRAYRLRLPDAIIYATAKVYNAALVTRNTNDFKTDWDGIRVPYQVG